MPRPIVMPGSRASSAAAARLERAELREAQRSARGNTQQADNTAAKVAAKAEAKVAAGMEAAPGAHRPQGGGPVAVGSVRRAERHSRARSRMVTFPLQCLVLDVEYYENSP